MLFQDALTRTKEELIKQGADRARVAELGYSVGIHCGATYCGNVGYEAHADYTALGNEVNIANRIEAQAEVYGVPTLISGSVADKIGREFCCVPLDTVRLRGQNTTETRLYHLAGTSMGGSERRAEERFGEIQQLIQTGQASMAVERIWDTLGDREFCNCYERSLNVLLKNVQNRSGEFLRYGKRANKVYHVCKRKKNERGMVKEGIIVTTTPAAAVVVVTNERSSLS